MTNHSSAKAAPDPYDRRTTFWSDTSLVGVALIWGINIPVMKTGLDQIDAFVFNAVRFAVSAIVLSGFALLERRRGILPKPGISRKQILIYAVLVSAVYHLFFLCGIARTTSGNTALIIASVPMWTALLARLFIGERLRRLSWLGLVVAARRHRHRCAAKR